MSDQSSENVALFSRPKHNYTDETLDSEHQSQTAYSSDEDYPPVVNQDGHVDLHSNHSKSAAVAANGVDGTARDGSCKAPPDEPTAIPPFDKVLSDIHEKAMQVVGFGRMQWLLYLALGLAFMGDGVELLLMAYVLPGAEKDFCMSSSYKGWLGAMAFAGQMFGSPILGNVGDKVGRKPVLVASLFMNAFVNIIGAFMPNYWLFLACRFLCGVSIGGSVPIVMACASEFSPMSNRGLRLGMMFVFWVTGGLYAAVMGVAIVPADELSFRMGEAGTFESWRVFLLVCVIPVLVAACCLIVMPESPRFLLQIGHDLEALAVYRSIYVWNHTTAGAEYEMPEIELPSRLCMTELHQKQDGRPKTVTKKLCNFCESFYQVFYTPLTSTTFSLAGIWFSVCFGYYGMSIWFPEFMKRLEQSNYFAQTNYTDAATISNGIFTTLLDNVHFSNTTFTNVNFTDIDLKHITFDNCVLRGCHFLNATARQTYFVQSAVYNSVFDNTNFYASRFVDTVLKNTTFEHEKQGCQIDFEISYSQRHIFLEALISQLAVVPTTVVSSFLLDRFGRVKILVVCLLLSGVSVFLIWVLTTEVAVVVFNAVFSCLVVGAFNAMDVASIELYPTHLRATAFAILVAVGRTAAILGNVTFGNLIDVSKSIPILITASVLITGGIISLKMPESRKKLV